MVDRCGGYHRQVRDVAEFGACRPALRPYLLRISLAPSRFLPPSPTAHTPTKRAPSADGARSQHQGCPKSAPSTPHLRAR